MEVEEVVFGGRGNFGRGSRGGNMGDFGRGWVGGGREFDQGGCFGG